MNTRVDEVDRLRVFKNWNIRNHSILSKSGDIIDVDFVYLKDRITLIGIIEMWFEQKNRSCYSSVHEQEQRECQECRLADKKE
mmetsp:Transcript_4401/g.8479  ORF Transcript_4401/g.8479 Transcript_4401/m.8479 type:complete len:83 (-) Transcript_4401:135-383(-)